MTIPIVFANLRMNEGQRPSIQSKDAQTRSTGDGSELPNSGCGIFILRLDSALADQTNAEKSLRAVSKGRKAAARLTLLFQDMVGGLEIHDHEADIFRPVLPKPGTMIVHIGDMLEKQSNERWKSALHHVTGPSHSMYGQEPVNADTVVDRFAIAFYAHPDYEMKIEALPGCEEKAGMARLDDCGRLDEHEGCSRI